MEVVGAGRAAADSVGQIHSNQKEGEVIDSGIAIRGVVDRSQMERR